tara:strand:+ start:10755 stop:11129 length:375 start_codon:yes stop_codon:yes gene_type:complete
MGRLFIDQFENNCVTYCCFLCKSELFQNKDVIVEHIETTFGNCSGVSDVLNTHIYDTRNDSCLHITNTISTYDDDAAFNIQNVKTKEVLCKCCYSHLGWLHDGATKLFIIQNTKVFLLIRQINR